MTMRFKQFYLQEAMDKNMKDIDVFIQNVGEASDRTEVYEYMAVLCAMVGKKPKNISEFEKHYSNSESPDKAVSSMKDLSQQIKLAFPKGTDEDRKALEQAFIDYIWFIGSQMTKLPSGVPKGFILKSIGTTGQRKSNIDAPANYYDSIDISLIDSQAKQNTADTVLVYKGSVEKIIQNMKHIDKSNVRKHTDKNGMISVIDAKGKEVGKILQVSLKKEAKNARIGKITTFLKSYLGKNIPAVPSAFIESELLDSKIDIYENWNQKDFDLINEGGWAFIKDKLKLAVDSAKGLYSKVKDLFGKLTSSVKAGISGMLNTINKDKFVKTLMDAQDEIAKAPVVESADKSVKITPALEQNVQSLFKLMKGKYIQKEYNKLIKNIKTLNKKTSNTIVLVAPKDPHGWVKVANKYPKLWKNWKKQGKVPRDFLSPMLKINVNLVGYKILNEILGKILSQAKSAEEMKKATAAFAVGAKTDAIFGNTNLALWKVFGGDTAPVSLGFKTDFKKETLDQITATAGKKPIAKFLIKPVKNQPFNSIGVYLLAGVDHRSGQTSYLEGELGTVSGSQFTYKFELNKEVPEKRMLTAGTK